MPSPTSVDSPSPWMQVALAAARRARGWCSPNPPVGAALVRDGQVVGVGHTQPAGQAHAEIVALADAAGRANGADLYVTLEPCCHWGRTPPCVDAIVRAGVRRVVVGALDPNPRVNGGGVAKLKAAGIDVVVGDGAGEAAELVAAFATYVRTGRPMVTAKYAMSLDGRIATHTGHAYWITGQVAREHVHQVRATVDVIVVGAGTVAVDDPRLTARPTTLDYPAHQPLRVVLDSTGRLSLSARVFDRSAPGSTLVATTAAMTSARQRVLADQGIGVETFPSGPTGVDVVALVTWLGSIGITSLLVEGGARVHGAFMEAGLVDRIMAYIAPVVIGGDTAPGAIGGLGARTMDDACRLTDVRRVVLGDDTLITASTSPVLQSPVAAPYAHACAATWAESPGSSRVGDPSLLERR